MQRPSDLTFLVGDRHQGHDRSSPSPPGQLSGRALSVHLITFLEIQRNSLCVCSMHSRSQMSVRCTSSITFIDAQNLWLLARHVMNSWVRGLIGKRARWRLVRVGPSLRLFQSWYCQVLGNGLQLLHLCGVGWKSVSGQRIASSARRQVPAHSFASTNQEGHTYRLRPLRNSPVR